uniref:Ubiquitin carboxyl-terminal hydrolase n=1 Tax=Panagrellus redivivus TaxID=6233 RepID=A0A7E5A0B2_PANRE
MARPPSGFGHTTAGSVNFGFHEVDKFLSNPRNTEFTSATATGYNGYENAPASASASRYDAPSTPRRRPHNEYLPSPDTLYSSPSGGRPMYVEYTSSLASPTRRSSRGKDRQNFEPPLSPPDSYKDPKSPDFNGFSRHDKVRKSSLKQVLNTFFGKLRGKPDSHLETPRSNLYAGGASKDFSVSAHTVNRTGSVKGSAGVQRNHSFSTPPRGHDRSRSVNYRERGNYDRADSERSPVKQNGHVAATHKASTGVDPELGRSRKVNPGPGLPVAMPTSFSNSVNIPSTKRERPPPPKNVFAYKPTPCVSGIANHGNSCYMNSTLQCLASSEKFAHLFITGDIDKYLKRAQCAASQRLPDVTQPSLSAALKHVLQCMWFGGNINEAAREFAHVIADLNPRLSNASQQDAQEFLIWFLDTVHEELKDVDCRNHRKPERDSRYNKCEDELAIEALSRHQGFHCSLVGKLFNGQFRSTIQCIACDRSNVAFDPFRTVSLTVAPADNLQPHTVIWIPYDLERKLIRYSVRVPSDATVTDMINAMRRTITLMMLESSIPFLLSNTDSHLRRLDLKSLVSATGSQPIAVVEVPINDTRHSEADYAISVCSFAIGWGADGRRKGYPFVVVLHRMWSFERIVDEILNRGMSMLNYTPDYLTQQRREEAMDECQILVNNEFLLESDLTFPLLAVHNFVHGQRPVFDLLVKFDNPFAERLFKTNDEGIEYIRQPIIYDPFVTLEQLISQYIEPELLDWTCTSCGKTGGKTQQKFHSVPPILVFHLKRFHLDEHGIMRRFDRRVRIPVEDLNMAPYVCPPKESPASVIRRSRASRCEIDSDLNQPACRIEAYKYTYDLVGVVNHFGERTNSGHYTSMTKNPIDKKWRAYDDDRVVYANIDQFVNSSDAYLLFYERRPHRSPSEHWYQHIPQRIIDDCIRGKGASSVNGFPLSELGHSSGVKTLPRPSFQSYVQEEQGIPASPSPNRALRNDRSRSYQNLAGSRVEYDYNRNHN